MKREGLPFETSLRGAFDNLEQLSCYEGGATYTAEREGQPVVIIDSRTMADFLDESERERLLHLLAFETEDERREWIAARGSRGKRRA